MVKTVSSPRNEVQGTQRSVFSVCLLKASDWSEKTHNLSNTTKRVLLDSLLQDEMMGAIIRVVFYSTSQAMSEFHSFL